MNCTACLTGAKGLNDRLPKGWHRLARSSGINPEGPYCSHCWAERYVLRAVTIPVVRPLGVSWSDFRLALGDAWAHSTALGNWGLSQLFAADRPREPGHSRLAAMPQTYLYPEAVRRFPDLPSQTTAAVLRAVQRKYRSLRYAILWTAAATLPSMRYPQPFVSPNQSWSPGYVSAGKNGQGDKLPAVEVTLLRGLRIALQLRGGRDFARQRRDFANLVSGAAIRGELSILRQRVGGNENRNGMTDRDSGAQRAHFRVMLKMVGWFPRSRRAPAAETLLVRTGQSAFLIAVDGSGRRIWRLNADHVRRWTVAHRRRLQRWSDDQKVEERPRASFQSRREAAALLFRRRVDTFQNEAAAQLAEFARRKKVATILFDDSDRDYFEQFDWTGFRQRLLTKLDELGIAFEWTTGPAVFPDLPVAAMAAEFATGGQ
jgi:hypothetical protein